MLIFEDEIQRILLIGNINAGEFVTGVVVALLGYENDSGKFVVEEICPASIPIVSPQVLKFPGTRYCSKSVSLITKIVLCLRITCFCLCHRYLAFVSGLDLGSGQDSLLAIQEMIFALVGKTGNPEIQQMMAKISRLIVAGKSVFILNS